jgi:hypothetical protein
MAANVIIATVTFPKWQAVKIWPMGIYLCSAGYARIDILLVTPPTRFSAILQ